jgi:predicted Zn finger-like uncharacterized protein
MRIACQKCSASYAIDDKFVTAKGVRAQCPRCRHLQLVKKDDPAVGAAAPPPAPVPPAPAPGFVPSGGAFDLTALPPPAASPAAAPFAFDFSAPPPAAPPPGPPAAAFNFAPAPAVPAAPAAASPFAFSAPPPPAPVAPFDFGGPPPPAPASAGFDFGALPPAPVAPAASYPGAPPPPAAPPSPFDFGSDALSSDLDSLGAPPAAAASATVLPRCKSCGKNLSDPFDQALGTCDDCRSKQASGLDGPQADSGQGLRERVDVGSIDLARTGAPRAAPVFPPAPSSAPPAGSMGSAAEQAAVRSALRESERSNRGRTLAGIGAVLLGLIAVGSWAYLRKPWVKKAPPLVVKTPTASARPVDAMVQQWKLNYPDLETETARQSGAHQEAGEQQLQRDTTQAYVDAREEFEKALVLDPGNDKAVAGWVLALSFGRPGQIDEATRRGAESLLAAAEQHSGDPRVYVAHAHLLVATGGNANDITVMAERGKNSSSPSDKALAALAIGQTLLGKNPQNAEASFSEALRLDPKLKRSYLFQARLHESMGRYRDAVEDLEKRLDLDPDQMEAAEQLARLYGEVGELAKGRKTLEKARTTAPQSARARLALAMYTAQLQEDLPSALEQLTRLSQDAEVPKKELADALAQLATVQRVMGDAAHAQESADRALELVADHLPAHLQKLLLLLDKGVASQARLEFDGLRARLGDPQLESMLEGRLLMAEGRADEAIKVLSELADKAPSRVDALLLAGAAAARARQDGKAWELCLKRALRSEPLVTLVPSLTTLYVRPADLLKPAVGAYTALAAPNAEDPNPPLCEGLVAWYSDDLTQADKQFARVTTIDLQNAEAFSFRAFIALRRKDAGNASRMASRAVGAGHGSGLAHLALAESLAGEKRYDLAKQEASQALKVLPALQSARVMTAEVDAMHKASDDARRTLTSVLLSDPSFRPAKQVLYRQSL